VLDIFEVAGNKQHTYDYVLHVDGRPATDGQATATPLGERCGYQHLTQIGRLATQLPWTGEWLNQDDHLRIMLLGQGEAEVFSASGPTTTVERQMAMLICRRRGQAAAFVSLIEARPEVSGLTHAALGEDGHSVTASGTCGDYWFAWDCHSPKLHGSFACVRSRAGRLTASLVHAQGFRFDRLSIYSAQAIDCTILVAGQTVSLRVQRGSGEVALSAPLPKHARVYGMRNGERMPVRHRRRGESWCFDVTPDSEYLIEKP